MKFKRFLILSLSVIELLSFTTTFVYADILSDATEATAAEERFPTHIDTVSENSIENAEGDYISAEAEDEIEGTDKSKYADQILTPKAIQILYQAIEKENGKLPENRKKVIKGALSYIGRLEYSQSFHAYNIATCKYNDCSGFVSDIWEIEKETTASFWHNYSHYEVDSGNVKPGDILLYYSGKIADCTNDHALLYVGNIGGEPCVIDCSTHGVNLRHVSYFNKCYYIPLGTKDLSDKVTIRKVKLL